jgi:hypothetical protein
MRLDDCVAELGLGSVGLRREPTGRQFGDAPITHQFGAVVNRKYHAAILVQQIRVDGVAWVQKICLTDDSKLRQPVLM